MFLVAFTVVAELFDCLKPVTGCKIYLAATEVAIVISVWRPLHYDRLATIAVAAFGFV